jgi:hypothetical protein
MSFPLWELFWLSFVVKKLLLEEMVWPVWRKLPNAGDAPSNLFSVLPLTNEGQLFERGMLLKREAICEMAGIYGNISCRAVALTRPLDARRRMNIPALFISHLYKSVPFSLLRFIEIRPYLYHQEAKADYLTGFLADAKSNKIDVIDLTDLSDEQLDVMLKQTLLTYGSAGSDRMCGNTAGSLKNVGHDPGA